ncbi:MAG: TIGR04282 family arsenosugar biosynthesis glycosyltransferase [Sakamotonia sp.]|jgi:rSAM/selenodomain-associated transferase 1
MRRAVICFTRVPRPGMTKTRLLPVLSPEQCAELHTAFLKDLARVYRDLDAGLFVAYAPDPDWASLKDMFPMAEELFPQAGEGLGERMDGAIRHVLSLGFERVVLTGTDLPEMGREHLESGFSALDHSDVVLGPTPDGGYYLVGTKAPCTAVFRDQQYGGGSVYENTRMAAEKAGLSLGRALACGDVDTPEDLERLVCQADPESHTGRFLATLKKEGYLL